MNAENAKHLGLPDVPPLGMIAVTHKTLNDI